MGNKRKAVIIAYITGGVVVVVIVVAFIAYRLSQIAGSNGSVTQTPPQIETPISDELPSRVVSSTDTPTATSTHTLLPPPATPSATSSRTPTNTPVSPTNTGTSEPTKTPTTRATGTSTRAPSALVKVRVQVRSGPGDEYDLLGYLPEGATAKILSQDETGEWWQIETGLARSGVGWIKADPASSEAINAALVPIALAPPTPTATATNTPIPPTATPSPTLTSTPTNTPAPPTNTATPMLGTPTSTPEFVLETTNETAISETDTLGEINIEYPLRLSPGSSDSVFVSILIPDMLVSLAPVAIERIVIPSEDPPVIREPRLHQATILIWETMRVELSSPTFEIESQYPSKQFVNTNVIAKPTFWAWTIVAPRTTGIHVIIVRVYPGDEDQPSWVGSLEIEVAEFTPTVTPTSTPVPFIQTSGGTAVIGAAGTIIAAFITGLIGFFVARKSFPVIGTKASYRRTLKTLYRNLAQLEEQASRHGMDVPLEITNEIEYTQEKITEIETKLAELKSD